MKACCRILISSPTSSFFGFPSTTRHSVINSLSNYRSRLVQYCSFHCNFPQILCFRRLTDLNQRSAFRVPGFNWDHQSRGLSGYCIIGKNRGFQVVSNIKSNTRHFSTTVESNVNEKNFEKIYIQGGVNVKPLVVEETDRSHVDVDKKGEGESSREYNEDSNVNIDKSKGLNVFPHRREETKIKKEAWDLLRESVVNYCGSPVGTVAANNPSDIQPLNYDQVFIRDFISSALAFLLKGEGEIVRNFLLHTLKLQSWEKTVDCHSPGQGLMPASFKVRTVPLEGSNGASEENCALLSPLHIVSFRASNQF